VRRITAILAIVSFASSVLSLLLLPFSYGLDLPEHVRGSNDIDSKATFSIGSLHCGAVGGRLWFFNDVLPYTGSIISLEGSWGGKSTTQRTDWSWGFRRYGIAQESFIDDSGQAAGKDRYADFPGIYYRHFEWWNRTDPWWTLAVSLWYPAVLFAVLPSWCIIRKYRGPPKTDADA
jgi:hypothetical protein